MVDMLMATEMSVAVATIVGLLLGICLAAVVFQMISRAKAKTVDADIERQLEGAKKEAENIIKSARIDAAGEAIKKKEQFTAEANQIRIELRESEARLSKREDTIDKQTELLQQQEKTISQQTKGN